MRWEEQGTVGSGRYTVVPRTLSFLTHGGDVLFLRGAPTKRIWAGKLNGVGGHIEPDEDPLTGAKREILEETGLTAGDLDLRAVVHVAGQPPDPGVVFLVYVGAAPSRETACGSEGELEWHAISDLPVDELVEDLPHLLPRILGPGHKHLVYGHYASDDKGAMRFTFRG